MFKTGITYRKIKLMFVLFYIKNTFDSVPHVSLISNIKPKSTSTTVDNKLLHLSNHPQYIEVNGKSSITYLTSYIRSIPGMSARSALISYLRTCINDITKVELNDGNLLIHTDDIILFRPTYCVDDCAFSTEY